MRILIATRINKQVGEMERSREALEYLRGKGYDAVLDEDLDWTGPEETREQVYTRVMKGFEGVLLIETAKRLIARGQYSLAKIAMQDREKHCWVWRDGQGVPVRYLTRHDENDWKHGYGRVTV